MWRATAVALLLVACGGSSTQSRPPATVDNRAEPAQPADATQPDDAERARVDAQLAADAARLEAENAKRRIDDLQQRLDVLDRKVDETVNLVVEAQNQTDRDTAKQRLELLKKEQAALEIEIQRAKEDADRAEKKKAARISPACQANPTAHECI